MRELIYLLGLSLFFFLIILFLAKKQSIKKIIIYSGFPFCFFISAILIKRINILSINYIDLLIFFSFYLFLFLFSLALLKIYKRRINLKCGATIFFLVTLLAYLHHSKYLNYIIIFLRTPRIQIEDKKISLSGIIISGLIFFSFFKFSKFIEDRIKAKIEKTSLLESTRSGLIPIIIRYTIIVIGFFISLEFLNIDLTSLKVLIGALGVGIGFGLREIVNNLISGIILLSDKTVVKNDLIEVKGLIGRVEKIGIRTTTIRTFNNFEVIIPNTELVNNELINHTHSDSIIRIVIPIGISYSSDPFLVKEILTKSLSKLNGILKDHPIEVFFTEFGENSLKFEISIWIDDPFKRKKIESEARFVIWKTLKENKIEIPYPQLDVHLKKS